MADKIEPIESKRKTEGGSRSADLMMAQLLAHRRDSMLKPDASVISPEDTVQRDPLLRIARTSAAYQKALAVEMSQAAQMIQNAQMLKTEADKGNSVQKEEADKARDVEKAAEHNAAASTRKRGARLSQDQSGGASDFSGHQNRQQMAFAQVGGDRLLAEAGEDPVLIRQALDTLAEAGIDSDIASRLYQEALLQSLSQRSVPKSMAQFEPAPAPSPVAPTLGLQLGPADTSQDEIPWNITPVKT